MSKTIRMPEVTAMLDKSSDTVQRYIKQGLLHATKNGREFLFNRDEVVAFAEKRGIHVKPEREVPQGTNFYQDYARICQKLPPGASLTFTKPAALVKA